MEIKRKYIALARRVFLSDIEKIELEKEILKNKKFKQWMRKFEDESYCFFEINRREIEEIENNIKYGDDPPDKY